MDVFLFCIANFSNSGVWLILEIICLGDLFTEQGRMDDVCKGMAQTDGKSHRSAHISSLQAEVLLTVSSLKHMKI